MRQAILHDYKLNGSYCVTFREELSNTVIEISCSFLTEHEALMEMSIFEHAEIWQEMARR